MSKISINELAKVLVEKNGLEQKEAELFVAAIFDVIQKGLERDSLVKVKGFGTFKIIGVEARESVNVNTGERVVIKSHGKITFTPDATMKELVNKPFSQFETVVLNEGIEFDDIKEEKDYSDALQDETPAAVDELPVFAEPDVDDVKTGGTNEPAEDELVEEEETIAAEPEILAGPETYDDAEVAVVQDTSEEEEEPTATSSTEEPVDTSDSAAGIEKAVAEPDAEDDNTENGRSGRIVHKLLVVLLSVVLVTLAFGGGYFFAMTTVGDDGGDAVMKSEVARPANTDSVKREVMRLDTVSVKADTLAASAQAVDGNKEHNVDASAKDSVGKGETKTAEKPADEDKKERTDVADTPAFDSSKYEQMDNRVRTGAYRIVGTDHVRTVKSGETLQGISRQLLGEGMSCYIEVYNGLARDAELKTGQKLKIPKLELKRKKTKR